MKTRTLLFTGILAAAGVRCVIAAANGPAEPEAFISLRGVRDDTIESGEPLFVGVRIEAPFESGAPLKLAPASGTWADGVEIVFIRGDVMLPPRATATFKSADASVMLDAERAASGEWFFPTAQMSQLAPGDYAVEARFALRTGAGWTGSVASEPVKIRVVAAGAANPARVLQRTIALANEALAAGRLEEGARLVDPLLADQPDNLRLLAIRARLSARAGDLRGAMTCVNRAMSTPEVEKLTHPPIGLFELQDEIAEALLSPAARNAAPPEWTKLPPRVLEPILTPKQATPTAAVPISIAAPSLATAKTATPVSPATPVAATPTPKPASGAPSIGTVVPAAELTEAKILADANGQWAARAKAGSEYGTPNYGAMQMTGAPDVPDGNDNPKAWCHHSSAKGPEWIELTYAKPVHATEVRVRQTYNPGAIVKVEAIDSAGAVHLWWQGVDPSRPPGALNAIAWFAVRVPKTDYLVVKTKITLDLDAVMSWQEIDAVQLVGTD